MTEQPKAMKFPFEEIKQTDAEGREWWNSRQMARIIGQSLTDQLLSP